MALGQNTTYRLEFRTANTYTSADAFDAAAWFHNLTIESSSAFSGTPSYLYETTCERSDEYACVPGTIVEDTTKPVLSSSSLLFNDSVIDAPFTDSRTFGEDDSLVYKNSIYHEFRTPAILAANGPEHCNEESGVDDVRCVYKFDFPHAYYVRVGTGISSSARDYGTMQFRVSRAGDQSVTGMTAPYEDGRKPSYPSADGLAALDADGATTTDGVVDFAGDVDWFNFSVPSGSKCNFRAAGRDVGGNTASGLRMRAFELPAGAIKAPSRGSLRSSLSNYRETGLRVLEVTGSRVGGYTITATCSPEVTRAPTPVASVEVWRSSAKNEDYKSKMASANIEVLETKQLKNAQDLTALLFSSEEPPRYSRQIECCNGLAARWLGQG